MCVTILCHFLYPRTESPTTSAATSSPTRTTTTRTGPTGTTRRSRNDCKSRQGKFPVQIIHDMYRAKLRLTHMYISTNKYKLSDIMATTCTHMRHIISTEIHTNATYLSLFLSESSQSLLQCSETGKKAWLFAKLQPGRARKRINAT